MRLWPRRSAPSDRHARETVAVQERRSAKRMEVEAKVTITTLNGESYVGILREMNGQAMSVVVQGELEPGNRVTIGYPLSDLDEIVEVDAIVRRRNGFRYVFDCQLVEVFDERMGRLTESSDFEN